MNNQERIGNFRTYLLIFLVSAVGTFLSIVWYTPLDFTLIASIAGGLMLVVTLFIAGKLPRRKR